MWRFWRDLPPKGEMGIYVGAWYSKPLTDRVLRQSGKAEFEQELQAINRFETMLAKEGALILKFWLHMSKKEQAKQPEKNGQSDARTRWRSRGVTLGWQQTIQGSQVCS